MRPSTHAGFQDDPSAIERFHTEAHALFDASVTTIADFPIEGILFKDIAPFLARKGAIRLSADVMSEWLAAHAIDKVLAIDARGFVLGAAVADRLDAGFVMVRKPGKLPGEVQRFEYTCEYRTGHLEMTRGIVQPGDRILVLDDLLATGGTARATADFARSLGAEVVGYSFMVEIEFLEGRRRLADAPVYALFKC